MTTPERPDDPTTNKTWEPNPDYKDAPTSLQRFSLATKSVIAITVTKTEPAEGLPIADHAIDMEVYDSKGHGLTVHKISDYRHSLAYVIALLAEFMEVDSIDALHDVICECSKLPAKPEEPKETND